MKAEIHPEYKEIQVNCSCGHSFNTRSTIGDEAVIDRKIPCYVR